MKHVGKIISKRALKAITEHAANYWWNKTQQQIKDKENMLHNSLITNNPPLFQYHQQNFTCDNCQQEYQQSLLYSAAKDKKELGKERTYCSNCAEPNLLAPVKVRNSKRAKPKKDPVAYYQCMSACCQNGISPKKITQIAHECKHSSLGILAERGQEIKKLNEAYQQIGTCLTNLLQPISE